ncbi:hypothetical protein P3342_009617 [Pyrenophora teres f. teres]|nr:hypothetical protein P3342_009617 [Pyrenophora teres f. teres]
MEPQHETDQAHFRVKDCDIITSRNDLTSPLLRLLPELRNIVFAYVLEPTKCYVVKSPTGPESCIWPFTTLQICRQMHFELAPMILSDDQTDKSQLSFSTIFSILIVPHWQKYSFGWSFCVKVPQLNRRCIFIGLVKASEANLKEPESSCRLL